MSEWPRPGPAPDAATDPATATQRPDGATRCDAVDDGVQWQIAADAAPMLHRWGDEFVVHHALSNDTYRLSAHAGEALVALMSPDGIVDDGPVDPRREACLLALAELGLVTRC